MMLAKPTIQRLAMQCQAHEAKEIRQYLEYGEGTSTAQRCNACKERIVEVAHVA